MMCHIERARPILYSILPNEKEKGEINSNTLKKLAYLHKKEVYLLIYMHAKNTESSDDLTFKSIYTDVV